MRRFFAARFVGELGNQFSLYAIPLLVYLPSHNAARSGTAFAVEWLARLSGLALAGNVVDRFGSRAVYMLAELLRSVSFLLAFVLVMSAPGSSYPVLLALGAVLGMSHEHFYIAGEALVGRVARRDVEHAQGILGILDQLALVAGPAVAALVAGLASTMTLLAVVGALALCGAGLVFSLPLAEPPSAVHFGGAGGRHALREMTVGFRAVSRSRALRVMVGLTMLSNLVLGVVLALGPALVTGVFRYPQQAYGLLGSVAGAVSALALVGGRLARRRCSAIAVGLTALCGIFCARSE